MNDAELKELFKDLKFYQLVSTDYGGSQTVEKISCSKEDLEEIIEKAGRYEQFWSANWHKPEFDFLPYPRFRHCYVEIEEVKN